MYKYTNSIGINLNKPFHNRTYRFLGPQVNRIFSKQQMKIFVELDWLTFSIYDALDTEETFNLYGVFRIDDIDYSVLCSGEYYIKDYPLIDAELDKHVIVYKLPINSMSDFLAGRYSLMYTQDQIDTLFIKTLVDEETGIEKYTDVYCILSKHPQYEAVYRNNFINEFDMEPVSVDEYDLPPLLIQEVLNYEKNPEKVNKIKQLYEVQAIL